MSQVHQEQALIDQMPEEVMLAIFEFTDNLKNCALVCKRQV